LLLKKEEKKMTKLISLIKKQNFNPGILGVFINPFFFARKNLYVHIKKYSAFLVGKTLDVGCGKKPYEHLFTNVSEYIGLDIENPGHLHDNEDIDVFYDGKYFPFANNSFDSVICNQVLEHVFDPKLFLSEINRVLKIEGVFLLTVPFVWDEHEQPNDFGRYSSFGLKHILKEAGFDEIQFTKSTQGFEAISQMLILYIYKIFYSKNRFLNLLFTLLLIAPFSIISFLLAMLLPKSKDFYLDNVVLLKKIQ
jgi:SAM-dependent methyltransferase